MKKHIQFIRYNMLLVAMALQLVSCSDWLDITPRSQIETEDNFESEQGYKDALTGIYLLMCNQSLYGKELTYGMVDALAQYYTGSEGSSRPYYYAMQYDYTETNMKSLISEMWKGLYNVIANVNELIAHIDNASPSLFAGRNYHLIRGEAYGLRAFLHFDLLRLFGKSYVAGADEPAIPYVTEVTEQVFPLSTTAKVLENILADLKIAEDELDVDPVIDMDAVRSTDDETFQRDRFYKFNYYAVKMLQARSYLYKGDYTEANKAAQSIVGQQTFTWTPESEYSELNAQRKNFVGSEELVFCLYLSNLNTLYSETFTVLNGMYMQKGGYATLFNEASYGRTDFRWLYQTDIIQDEYVCSKLRQPLGGAYLNRLPLMRISEAYYIAAECALQSQNQDAVTTAAGYLNLVRQKRGILAPLTISTVQEVETEVYKEYAKEFFCEGQLFFYFKRKNQGSIPVYKATTGTATPNYVFPMPDDELEYGRRTQNN